jgi:hypothetical protein
MIVMGSIVIAKVLKVKSCVYEGERRRRGEMKEDEGGGGCCSMDMGSLPPHAAHPSPVRAPIARIQSEIVFGLVQSIKLVSAKGLYQSDLHFRDSSIE